MAPTTISPFWSDAGGVNCGVAVNVTVDMPGSVGVDEGIPNVAVNVTPGVGVEVGPALGL